MKRRGLRMVVVGNIPSPWGEAAKGILHVKGIDWAAVRLAYDSEPLKAWAGQRTAPVAFYDDEPRRPGWADILLLAERLAPTPALLPTDPAARALVFGLAHEICGEEGLGWSRRLQLVHAGLHNAGGFPEASSRYLGRKYGYRPETETDLRKVFDRKDVDVVGVATPNHWHTLATIWACQANKDVYVEKPGSHNVYEGRKMIERSRLLLDKIHDEDREEAIDLSQAIESAIEDHEVGALKQAVHDLREMLFFVEGRA